MTRKSHRLLSIKRSRNPKKRKRRKRLPRVRQKTKLPLIRRHPRKRRPRRNLLEISSLSTSIPMARPSMKTG
jgi:hypothetical protein